MDQKKKAFPSFKSAPKPPSIQQSAPPKIARNAKRKLVVDDEPIFDIDRKGDMDIFRYGVREVAIPTTKDTTRVDFRLASSLNAEPCLSNSSNINLNDFIALNSMDSSEERIRIHNEPNKQESLNKSLSKDLKNAQLWLELVDLQEALWKDLPSEQRPKRAQILEKQLSILEKAQKNTNDPALKIRELRCKAELLPYEEMRQEWTGIIGSTGAVQDEVVAAYLDWITVEVGLARFNVETSLEAFRHCVTLAKNPYVVVFRKLILFLREIGYQELMIALLRAFFDINWLGADSAYPQLFDTQQLDYMKEYQPGQTELNSSVCTSPHEWLQAERDMSGAFWFPRIHANLHPDEPLEDYEREVVWDDIEPFMFRPMEPVLLDDFLDLLIQVVRCHVDFLSSILLDSFNYLSGDSLTPAFCERAMEILVESLEVPKLGEFVKNLLRSKPECFGLWMGYAKLQSIQGLPSKQVLLELYEGFSSHRRYIALKLCQEVSLDKVLAWSAAGLLDSDHPSPTVSPTTTLKVKKLLVESISGSSEESLQRLGMYYIYASSGGSFEALLAFWKDQLQSNPTVSDLLVHFGSTEDLRPHIFSDMLEVPGMINLQVIRTAWELNRHVRFNNKFRKWFMTRADSLPESIWKLYIQSELAQFGSVSISLLEEATKHSKCTRAAWFWEGYFLSERDPSRLKAVIYRAISSCPASKNLFMAAIEAGTKCLSQQEQEELINLMEEKGLRLYCLLELSK